MGKGGHGDWLGDGGSREVETTGLFKEHLLGLLLAVKALLSQRSEKELTVAVCGTCCCWVHRSKV